MGKTDIVCKPIILEPLETTLFFRDGKPFQAKGHGTSGLPAPQTLAGALRTWFLNKMGCDFHKLSRDITERQLSVESAFEEQGPEIAPILDVRFRGPWLSLEDRPVFTLPASLRRCKGSANKKCAPGSMLLPLKGNLPGWKPPQEGMLPLWCRNIEPLENVEGFLTIEGMRHFLRGSVPQHTDCLSADELYDFDHRIGIGIDSDSLTTIEGGIYSISLLALKEQVAFYAELEGPAQLLNDLADDEMFQFGGEKRQVRVRSGPLVDWDSLSNRSGEGRPMLVLITPGLFASSWKPTWLQPIAAAVHKPLAVSGWDLARGGPKPTRFAAPAGSVYFLDRPLDRNSDSLCESEDAALGWGLCLEGRWNYA